MANYKVKDNKIYADISKLTEEELNAVKNYKALGYELEQREFKKGISKNEMLEELSKDAEYKADFEKAYSIKTKELEKNAEFISALKEKYGIRTVTKEGKAITGYHLACKIYTKWKKANKKK